MRRPPRARVLTSAVALALTCGLAAGLLAPAAADPTQRRDVVDDAISSLQEDMVGTSAELQAAVAALAEAQAQLPVAQAALEEAVATQAQAERRDAELARRLTAAQAAETAAQERVEQDVVDIDRTSRSIGRLAAQSYRSGGMSASLSAVISSQDPAQFADRYVLASTVQRSQTSSLYRLQAEQAVQSNAQARLEAVQAEVTSLREQAADNLVVARDARREAADRRVEVDRLVAARAAATEEVAARQAEEQAQLATLEAERVALQAEIARLAEEARRRAAASASAAPVGDTGGVLTRPTAGRVSSEYGMRVHPISGVRRLHAGIDLAPGCGAPVVAAEAGTVVSTGWAGGYGNRVMIDHGLLAGVPVLTTYNHLSGYAVRTGPVERGQVIGFVGTTGASTGCHLHFEVYVDGATVDPRGWTGGL